MKPLMQSGVGMLILPPEPRMSDSARRIVRCAAHLRLCMQCPEVSPWFDHHIYEVDTALRGYASEYIGLACQDLDFHAFLSREAAAGRRFSAAFAKGGFCQAGVVAPPDSLMDEKTPSARYGAAR